MYVGHESLERLVADITRAPADALLVCRPSGASAESTATLIQALGTPKDSVVKYRASGAERFLEASNTLIADLSVADLRMGVSKRARRLLIVTGANTADENELATIQQLGTTLRAAGVQIVLEVVLDGSRGEHSVFGRFAPHAAIWMLQPSSTVVRDRSGPAWEALKQIKTLSSSADTVAQGIAKKQAEATDELIKLKRWGAAIEVSESARHRMRSIARKTQHLRRGLKPE